MNERFEGGVKLVAQSSDICDGCYYEYKDCPVHTACSPGSRADQRSIIWVRANEQTNSRQVEREPMADEEIATAVRHLYRSDMAAQMALPCDISTARVIEAALAAKWGVVLSNTESDTA